MVLDVEGTWRELTGVVNRLAAHPTSIAKIPENAVVPGGLSEQLEVDRSGEILT